MKYRYNPSLGYCTTDYAWKIYWNEIAVGGPLISYQTPDYDIPDLLDRAGNLIDKVTIVKFDDEEDSDA